MRDQRRAVRPRTPNAKPEPTSPGDTIEIAITAETTNSRGQKFWAKAGLSSTHREGETTEDAHERVQSFVVEATESLVTEWRS